MKDYRLIETARAFLIQLAKVDEETLNDTYQRLASEANDVQYATRLNVKSALCAVITAEEARRAYEFRQEHGDDAADEMADGRNASTERGEPGHSHN